MNRYAMIFSKTGMIKYISHLDLMRLFKRVFQRLDFPVSYTKGYHPHPRFGFAQPLALGYEGAEEYLEVFTDTPVDGKEIKERMNLSLPEGITVKNCTELAATGKSLASLVTAASYTCLLPFRYAISGAELAEEVSAFLAQKSILVEKKEKKSKIVHMVDIRDKIRDMTLTDENGQAGLTLILDTGSVSYLNPELVLVAFLERYLPRTQRPDVEVRRNFLIFNERIVELITDKNSHRTEACIPHTTGLH